MKKVVHFYTTPDAMGGPTTYIDIITSSAHLQKKIDFSCVYQQKRLNQLRLKDIRRIINEFKEISPDVIHIHGLQGEGFVGVLCSKLYKKAKILVTVHGMQHNSFNAGKLKRFVYKNIIEKWTLRNADGVFCVCEATEKDKYISKNAKALIPYLHNCVPQMPEYDRQEERHTLGFKESDVVIVSVGRITVGKGAKVLADIIEKDTDPSHKYLILGDGDYFSAMKERLKEQHEQGKVIFTGNVSDVGKYLSASDIYISTSYKENLSIAILEAGYYGLPCIVTPVGGNVEVIKSGYNGEVFDVEDSEGFIKALDKVLTSNIEKYRQNAKENISERFSVAHLEKGLEKIYDDLLSNSFPKKRTMYKAR